MSHEAADGPGTSITGRTKYEDAGGAGAPIVALHGTFGRGRTFARVAEALAPDYRIIAPDLRGHGHRPRHHPCQPCQPPATRPRYR